MLYIIIAILIFGLLIAVHELGHFLTAKLFGIRVNEFSIGMGPALIKHEKGETLYSLRALPIGGFCAMEGEDGESDDPRAFGSAAGWKKIIVLSAGAFMNFLTGYLIILLLFAQTPGFIFPAVAGFLDGYGLESCGLQAGDVVLSVDGEHMFSMYNGGRAQQALARAGDSVDWVVLRDGRRLELKDVYMPVQERVDETGKPTYLRGLSMGSGLVPATLGNRLLYSWYGALDYVNMVWFSLGQLVSGNVGLQDLSGPVGIVDTMTQVGSHAETPAAATNGLLTLAALIAVNLAVMNLLPLPALDGGRIFFLVLNGLLYRLFRRRIDPKYEGYVHMAGMALLMSLMLLVTLSDVSKLFTR